MLPDDADSLLARRYENDRPGLALVKIEDAAVPATVVTADVLAQERKSFPLLDEFVLRMAAVGVTSDERIAAVLGLPDTLVTESIADQLSADNLDRVWQANTKTVRLTAKGRRSVEDLGSINPVRDDFDLLFDRLAWKMRPYKRSELVSLHEAEEAGMVILPSAKTSAVELGDVTPAGINDLLKSGANEEERVEVLSVKKIKLDKARRFLQAKLLIYADPNGAEIQLAVAIDNELSPDHDRALERLGGAAELGITVGPPVKRPALDADLEQLRTDEAAADQAERIIPQAGQATPVVPTLEVRSIGVHEHPPLLQQALTTATSRVLICSPWIKSAVITTDLLGKLEQRLRRRVRVDIAHGYEDGSKSDPRAVQKLENLASRFPDLMKVTRLKNTHAKILIFDNVWITTSFNWLSFRGDPNRTYRMEEGNYVRSREHSDREYEKYLKMIEDQAA